MSLIRISSNVYNVGVAEPFVRQRDFGKACPYGTLYNSYFIDDRKTAVIDMVGGEYADDFLYNLGLVADIGAVDYLILNSITPQCADGIKKLLSVSPKTTIVCLQGGREMLDSILDVPYTCVAVNSGDKLNLGRSTLEFIDLKSTPSPDSMCTYFENDSVLFSGRIFSTDFCDPKVLDEELTHEKEYFEELKSYFNYYLSPYKQGVQGLLNELSERLVYCIAPASGLVVSDRVKAVFESYSNWCKIDKEKTAAVLYASANGCTKKMAQIVYDELISSGIKAELIDMQTAAPEYCAEKIEKAAYIAAGSSTVNNGLPSCVYQALSKVQMVNNSEKQFFTFGSYGWSGEGADLLNSRLKETGMKSICPPIKACMRVNENDVISLKNAVETQKAKT